MFTPSHPSRAPKHEASGWAAGVGMQCFCLLELAMEIELFCRIQLSSQPFVSFHSFLFKESINEVTGGSESSILD